MELIHEGTFNEDSTLTKIWDLPIVRKENYGADAKKQEEPSSDESMPNVEGLMEPIDPHPSETSTSRQIPLWLTDAPEYVDKHIALRGKFRESKK